MEKKNYKLTMWKVLSVNTKTLVITFLSFCFCVQFSLSTDISVRPFEIKFNYETPGYSNDALTLKKDNDNYVTAPEWKYNAGNPIIEKFAYIKEQSSRKIQVRFDSNCDSMHLIKNLTITSGTGIGEICNYFVANYSKLDWITLTVDGSVTGSAGIRSFTWQWDIYAIPVNSGLCSATSINSTIHTYYTLLADPQDPMAEPWIDVLDYSCVWASGYTTEYYVAQKVTEGIYYMEVLTRI